MADLPSRETIDAQQRKRTGLALFAFLLAIALGMVVMASSVVAQLSLPGLATSSGSVETELIQG